MDYDVHIEYNSSECPDRCEGFNSILFQAVMALLKPLAVNRLLRLGGNVVSKNITHLSQISRKGWTRSFFPALGLGVRPLLFSICAFHELAVVRVLIDTYPGEGPGYHNTPRF